MLKKIKQMSVVEWGVVASAVIILLALPAVIGYLAGKTSGQTTIYSPWSIAESLESVVALKEFRAEQLSDNLFLKYRIQAFVGILLFYIIGPGLLIFDGIGSDDKTGSLIPFKAGLVLVLVALINLGMEAVLTPIERGNTRKSAANSRQVDQMRNDMLAIGQASYQYYILPDSLGGNGGSFADISLDKLDVDLALSPSIYRLRSASDTLLKIVGAKPSSYPSTGKDSIRLEAHTYPNTIMDWKDPK